MQWYLNGDVAPVGRFNFCYSTTGSGEYVPSGESLGNSYIDFTNPDRAEEIKTYFMSDKTNATCEFTADGLRLTSTGAESGLVLDFAKATPQLILENYNAIEITYVVEDSKTTKLRTTLGAGSQPQVQVARARAMDVEADGKVHTATITLKTIRVFEGYLNEFGLFFDKTAAAGDTVLIKSIQFVQTAE